MNQRLKRALSDWNHDVDNEMARLIESGMSPIDAAERAAQIIRAKRRQPQNRFPFDVTAPR